MDSTASPKKKESRVDPVMSEATNGSMGNNKDDDINMTSEESVPPGGSNAYTDGNDDVDMDSQDQSASKNAETEDMKQQREARALELKEKGNEAHKSGRYNEAIDLYQQALEADSTMIACYTNMAAAQMMTGDYAGAAANCEKASEIDPDAVRPYMRGGRAYLCMGDFDKAEKLFTMALVRDPRDKKANEERETSKLTRRRVEKLEELVASKDYSRAIRMADAATKDAPACLRLQLKRIEAKIGAKQYDDAYALTTDLLPKFPSERQLLLLRAKALQYQGNVQSACRHLQEALRYDPDNQDIAKALKLCRKLDNLKQAGNDAFKVSYSDSVFCLFFCAFLCICILT